MHLRERGCRVENKSSPIRPHKQFWTLRRLESEHWIASAQMWQQDSISGLVVVAAAALWCINFPFFTQKVFIYECSWIIMSMWQGGQYWPSSCSIKPIAMSKYLNQSCKMILSPAELTSQFISKRNCDVPCFHLKSVKEIN